MGVGELSTAAAGNWGSRGCRSGTGLLSCAGARGDIGARSGTAVGTLSFASVVRLDSAGGCGGTGGCGCGDWAALLVSWWAGGGGGRIEGVAGV